MNSFARRFISSSFFLWLIVGGLALYFPLRKNNGLKFGIDLVGGSYITLQVQTDEAINAELAEKLKKLPDRFKKARLKLLSKDLSDKKIKLTFDSADAAQNAVSMIRDEDPRLDVDAEGTIVKIGFKDKVASRIAEEAVETDVEVIRTRIDKFGVAEPVIARQGERNIIVELPDTGVQEAKAAIGKSAKLEFRIVDKKSGSKEDLLYEYDGDLPDDKEILPGRFKAELSGPEGYYLVDRFTDVTGKLVKQASAQHDLERRAPAVSLIFNATGSNRFYDLTRKNPGKQLAIVLDGVVIDTPWINQPIAGGSASISPMPSMDAAKELAILLKSGAYVASVNFEEERRTEATLGASSIKQGLLACLIGLGMLLFFAIFYYGYAGILAFIALLFNLALVLFGLWYLGARLTLPGLAGMVLTVGMAIDASILIFENIKEELANGLSLRNAINAGFKDVLVVILDANITTFIVGLVLYWVGTGPIQGFAITLMLGIVATLITGLLFLRTLLNFVIDTFNVQKMRF